MSRRSVDAREAAQAGFAVGQCVRAVADHLKLPVGLIGRWHREWKAHRQLRSARAHGPRRAACDLVEGTP